MKRISTLLLAMTCCGALAACTNNQGINAATGGLAGAAVGSQVGGGSGRTTAILAGAALGTAVGANQPTTQQCTYRNPDGSTYRAAC